APALDGAQAADAAKPAAKAPPVTKILAQWILASSYDTLPENVRREGVRSFLNWVGVAIGGSHHETVDVAVSALQPFSGPPQAGLF
ncbi:MmgE/PrpD family protein, partial [Listeria monocytogenes]